MNVASAGEAADQRRRQITAQEKAAERPDVPVHTLCRRRKSTAERLGRSPGSEVQSVLCGCFTFPGPWPSGRSKQRPHLQWRDRAGFTPDFPVMPLAGTQARLALYHDAVGADKSGRPVSGAPIEREQVRVALHRGVGVGCAVQRDRPLVYRRTRCLRTVGRS